MVVMLWFRGVLKSKVLLDPIELDSYEVILIGSSAVNLLVE